MKKAILILPFLFLVAFAFCQNNFIQGRIINSENNKGVTSVKVIRMDSLSDVSSDKNGFFKISVPAGEKISLIFSHPDFELQTNEIKPELIKTPLLIKLVPNEVSQAGSPPLKYKNTLAFAPIELLFLGLTFEYERTLSDKHAIGGYATALLNRRFWMFSDNTSLTGIKIEPFYRYYVWKNSRNSGFGQVKLTYANFTIHEDDSYNQPTDTRAQAFGIGIAWGWKLFHSKINRHTIELVVGAKFVPVITDQELADAIQNFKMEYWWGGLGPGAVFDIKFTLGGIF